MPVPSGTNDGFCGIKASSPSPAGKIGKSNKVIEEDLIEKSFNNTTEEKIRKEENRKESRIDESNFETLD